MATLLSVTDLKTHFRTDAGLVKAVDGVSYHIDEQEIVAIVGESGCGKSVSQLSVIQLIPTPPGEIVAGEAIFEGRNLFQAEKNSPEMRAVRGGKIAMVFQEPMSSLNPVLTIGNQLTEALELHLGLDRHQAHKRALELIDLVGIPDGAKRIDDYPHQFSGGMRQRVMIAMAMSCNPKIIIADEPTTALDVTTQAQLLELMAALVNEFKASLVIITHNLGVVARYAQRLYVMYAGRIVESGTSKEIFGTPKHPYTISLLRCVPRLDAEEGLKLESIPGLPPNLINMRDRCAFRPRCRYQIEKCKSNPWPHIDHVGGSHYVSCYVTT